MEILGVVVCTIRVVKRKEYQLLCRKLRKLCIEYRAVIDRVV